MSPPRSDGAPGVVVHFSVEAGLDAAWDEPRLRPLIGAIVRREFPSGEYGLALHLVDDGAIRQLNAAHRGQDVTTDVLSFPLYEPDGERFVLPPNQPIHLGDVIVSYPRAVEQASSYGHSRDRELAYLVAHGVLHVLGYDHEDQAERALMRQREEEALGPLGFTR